MGLEAADQAAADMGLELLARGEAIHLVVRGRSMHPFIRGGDTLTISPDVAELRLGEAVLVRRDGFGMVHRVVGRRPDGRLRIKGDALPRSDGWFEPAEIRGRVVIIWRAGRPVPTGRWLPLGYSAFGGFGRAVMHGVRFGGAWQSRTRR